MKDTENVKILGPELGYYLDSVHEPLRTRIIRIQSMGLSGSYRVESRAEPITKKSYMSQAAH